MDGVFMSLLRGGSRVSIGAATARNRRARSCATAGDHAP
jgi:hypothetical protein